MRELDQFEIIQEALSYAWGCAEEGLKELRVEIHAEDHHQHLAASYLVERNGLDKVVGLLGVRGFDDMKVMKWLMMLRDNLAQAGGQKFTSCRIWMTADGKYEAKYGYDPIDWDALVPAPGLFDENSSFGGRHAR